MSANLNTMWGSHIAQMHGTFEPQRGNHALLTIATLGDQFLEGGQVTLALQTFPIPKQSNSVLEHQYLNDTRKVAGRVTHESMSVTYSDFIDVSVAQALMNWRRRVYDPTTGRIGLASDYKQDGEVILYSPSGAVVTSYSVHGMWPSQLDHGDIDLTGDELIKLTMTIEIDNVIPLRGVGGQKEIGISAARS